MKITSPSFAHNGNIPSEFTCDGKGISPQLDISEVPPNAKSLALIMDDPDAPVGTFVHWVVWNIPPATKQVTQGSKPQGSQGKTGTGKPGYVGPCPPSGTHRYFFKLYALDIMLNIPEDSSKQEMENAIQEHIVGKAELIGLYNRIGR